MSTLGDDADRAAVLEGAERECALQQHAARPRAAVRYLCRDCGEAIPLARVLSGRASGDPVQRCVDCQRQVEGGR